MKATEAKRITEQNKKPLNDVFNEIEATAKAGKKIVLLFDVEIEEITELIKLGYKLEKGIDPLGFEVYKCTW